MQWCNKFQFQFNLFSAHFSMISMTKKRNLIRYINFKSIETFLFSQHWWSMAFTIFTYIHIEYRILTLKSTKNSNDLCSLLCYEANINFNFKTTFGVDLAKEMDFTFQHRTTPFPSQILSNENSKAANRWWQILEINIIFIKFMFAC